MYNYNYYNWFSYSFHKNKGTATLSILIINQLAFAMSSSHGKTKTLYTNPADRDELEDLDLSDQSDSASESFSDDDDVSSLSSEGEEEPPVPPPKKHKAQKQHKSQKEHKARKEHKAHKEEHKARKEEHKAHKEHQSSKKNKHRESDDVRHAKKIKIAPPSSDEEDDAEDGDEVRSIPDEEIPRKKNPKSSIIKLTPAKPPQTKSKRGTVEKKAIVIPSFEEQIAQVDPEFSSGLEQFFFYFTANKYSIFSNPSIMSAMTSAAMTCAAARLDNATVWVKVLIDAIEEEKNAELVRAHKGDVTASEVSAIQAKHDVRVKCLLVSCGITDRDVQETLVSKHTSYRFAEETEQVAA